MLSIINLSKKKKANYKRTSSGGQDLELQISSNAEFIKEYDEEDVIEFTDFDISATKLAMDDRPALSRMLKLIKQGKIATVIVYERDRLARNVYEYIAIVQVFYQHQIEVIYTASDAPPFNSDLFVEAWFGLSAQFEGQRIKTRLSDARKRNPPQLLGYKKKMVKINEHEKKRYYEIDKNKVEDIYNLFKDFSVVKTYKEIFDVIMKYQKVLNRSDLRIIDILKNPFYAAHYINVDGSYKELHHVEPIIDLPLFKQAQEILNEFELGINHGVTLSHRESMFVPRCGKCAQELKFKKGNIGESGTYYCTKHRKYSITVKELHQLILDSLKISANRISFSELKKLTVKVVNEKKRECKNKLYELERQLEEVCIKASLTYKPSDDLKMMKKHFQQINVLKEKITNIDNVITQLDVLKEEINFLVEITQKKLQSLSESELMTLAELLISNIVLHEEHVLFNFYFSDFFKEEGVKHVY